MNFYHYLSSLAYDTDNEMERYLYKIHRNVTFKNWDTILLVVTGCCSTPLRHQHTIKLQCGVISQKRNIYNFL